MRFGHLIGVVLWLGGMIMMGAVLVPVARAIDDRERSRALIRQAARRFGIVGGIGWVFLLVTGFGLLDHRGISISELPDSEYGQRVMIKLILLLVMGIIVVLHAAWQGQRVTRADAAGDTVGARRWRILGGVFDSLLLLGSLAALWLAVSLIP